MSGWDYQARSAEVDAERAKQAVILQENVQKRPLVKPALQEAQATTAQLELFELVGQSSYDYVEALLRKLPSKRQREHFRRLYLREYHSVADDGSIAWEVGNKQRTHANHFLRELLEKRLGKVFQLYRYDLRWLSMSLNEKWQWAWEQGEQWRERDECPALFSDAERAFEQNEKPTLPFYLMTEKKLAQVADHLAFLFGKYQADAFQKQAAINDAMSDQQINAFVVSLYRRLGLLSESVGLPLPYWATFSFKDGNDDFAPNMKSVEVALNKAACEKWWLEQLQKAQKQMVEHLAIACGEVRKGVAAYISEHGFAAWKTLRKKNFDYLKSQILLNLDNEEEQVELLDMYLKSSANTSIRHKEMMNCLRGIEEWADEYDHQALFLTLTAPSKFHAQLDSGGQNPKWNGSSPKQTQAYLNKVWAQYRALLKKRGIKFYGMRVAEPHHDGTPHWHLLMYVAKEHVEEVSHLFKAKALEMDGDEAGAKKHRCKVELCDPEKGSATAYIVKYITKNMGGLGDTPFSSDEVEGLSFKDNAGRVRAWASMWGIRQFQFYGVASIGVWRELRRLTKGQVSEQGLEELRLGADVGDYAFYLDKQGGGGATRNEWRAKLVYEEMEENAYGEVGKRIVGVKGLTEEVKSRLKRWKSVPKRSLNSASRSEATNTGRSPAWTWTCVSNCNPSHSKGSGTITRDLNFDNKLSDSDVQSQRLKTALGWRGIDYNLFEKHHLYSLLNGGAVRYLGNDYLAFNGWEIEITRKRAF